WHSPSRSRGERMKTLRCPSGAAVPLTHSTPWATPREAHRLPLAAIGYRPLARPATGGACTCAVHRLAISHGHGRPFPRVDDRRPWPPDRLSADIRYGSL